MTFVALIAATILAGLVQDWIKPYVGVGPSAAVALAVLVGGFYFLRRWLADMRGDRPLTPNGSVLAQMPAAHRFLFTHMHWIFRGFLLISVVTLVSSIGLLHRKNWARLCFIALLGLGILYQVVGFALQSTVITESAVSRAANPDPQFATFVMVMETFAAAMAVALVLLFSWMIRKLASADVRAEFGA